MNIPEAMQEERDAMVFASGWMRCFLTMSVVFAIYIIVRG